MVGMTTNRDSSWWAQIKPDRTSLTILVAVGVASVGLLGVMLLSALLRAR
jgi:hypothetical protein